MKKILIWDSFELSNIGGPSGYLYNVHEFLKENPSNQIVFLSDLIRQGNQIQSSQNEINRFENKGHISKLSKIVSKLFCNIDKIYDFCWRQYRDNITTIPSFIDLNSFELIHFHWITQIIGFKKKYPHYKGKVVLSSHSPCLYVDEYLENRSPIYRLFRIIALYNEYSAFKYSDYWMFPCVGARAPYEKEKIIKRLFHLNENKFFYVPTSIMDVQIKENCQLISEFGVPKDSFVIGFFGRHNKIKGFDILVKVGERLLNKYDNLYFVCAGRGDVVPLHHDRWIELGFIKNTKDLLPQCDLYILPNRETYFDIITLEVLRAGVNVILSKTGGNLYFQELPSRDIIGIDFFDIDNIDLLLNKIELSIKEKMCDLSSYNKRKEANRKLFETYFSMEKYVDSYIDAINAL